MVARSRIVSAQRTTRQLQINTPRQWEVDPRDTPGSWLDASPSSSGGSLSLSLTENLPFFQAVADRQGEFYRVAGLREVAIYSPFIDSV